MSEGWIVKRIESSGNVIRTGEFKELDEAVEIYDNWSNNANLYHDQEVYLIKVTHDEYVILRYVTTSPAPKGEA